MFFHHFQDSKKWEQVQGENSPQPRHFHCSIIYQNKLYLFGGKSNGYHNSLHKYNFETNVWSHVEPDPRFCADWPIARYGHAAICNFFNIFISFFNFLEIGMGKKKQGNFFYNFFGFFIWKFKLMSKLMKIEIVGKSVQFMYLYFWRI